MWSGQVGHMFEYREEKNWITTAAWPAYWILYLKLAKCILKLDNLVKEPRVTDQHFKCRFFVLFFASGQMHHVRSTLGLIHIMECVCVCVAMDVWMCNILFVVWEFACVCHVKGLDFPLMTKAHIYLVQITEIISVFFPRIALVLIHFWCKWTKKNQPRLFI